MSRATISEEELESIEVQPKEHLPELVMNQEKIDEIMNLMNTPVEKQKELATKISIFINHQIDKELAEKGYLTDHTRRWVKEYNELLDKIQKNLYGDKSVSLHLHKVTHAHIASEMRKYADKTY